MSSVISLSFYTLSFAIAAKAFAKGGKAVNLGALQEDSSATLRALVLTELTRLHMCNWTTQGQYC